MKCLASPLRWIGFLLVVLIASHTVDARGLPLFSRTTAGTTWVRVHDPGTSPCPPLSVTQPENGQTADDVWCFEGAGGEERTRKLVRIR